MSHLPELILPLSFQHTDLPPASAVPGVGSAPAASPSPATTQGTQAPGGPAPGQAPSPGGGPMQMLVLFGVLFLFMWFFVLRPERRRQRERTSLLSALKKGDRVVTSGGLHGTIVSLDEKFLVLKVDDSVRLKFDRSAVGRVASSKTAG